MLYACKSCGHNFSSESMEVSCPACNSSDVERMELPSMNQASGEGEGI
jgi:Zn finger protein HypA/HybF involved in hydrogenase expression